jgi:peptidoglycan/xylan/chitin deacetylase (PgdA/CDA1 family)
VGGLRGRLKTVGKLALRHSLLRTAALRAGARLGNGLVLVYHRILPHDAPDPGLVVPSVSASCLKQHIEALSALGDIVPLHALLERAPDRRRPRFAVTFDDDYVEHVTQARRVLDEIGTPATFFLSGRALHRLPAYWWEQLEWLIADRGVRRTAQAVGLPPGTPLQLATACETDPGARQRLALEAPVDPGDRLDETGIRMLAGTTGVTIGFHTLRHELLTSLGESELQLALTEGRTDLEAVVGKPLTLFAYPHGKAGYREAAAVRTAGYLGAWTGMPRPIRPRANPFLLGRWECGPLDVDTFAASLAVRLHRSAPPARAVSSAAWPGR